MHDHYHAQPGVLRNDRRYVPMSEMNTRRLLCRATTYEIIPFSITPTPWSQKTGADSNVTPVHENIL